MQACYERASAYNLQFAVPLDENEVNGIAKSIANWTICNMSEFEFREYVKKTHTSKIQALRGKIGGCKSKGGGRRKNSSCPTSERTTKPWVLLGISRSTYYRKKSNKFKADLNVQPEEFKY